MDGDRFYEIMTVWYYPDTMFMNSRTYMYFVDT